MARILLDPNDTGLLGGTHDIFFNAAGAESPLIAAGSNITVFGFQRGGETIRLTGPASSYTVTASGANVIITGLDGSVLKLTVGSTAGTIAFNDGSDSRSLAVVGGQVQFGGQTLVNGAATPVTPGAGTYSIVPADGEVFHDEGTAVTFTITRTTATAAETLVYSVSGDTNGGTVNPAIGGEDFLNGGGTVNFAAGETSKTITVNLVGDNLVEGAEGFKVTVFKGASVVATTAGLINDSIDTDSFTLTNNVDVGTANVFNSQPVYTPGGNDFINSLQDEDILTGTGDNPTLNVTLGSVNDSAESVVAPILNGVQTVNVGITGDAAGINFQDATGLQTLNLNRLTQDNAEARFEDLDRTVTELSVNNATRDGEVHFHYREEVLTESDEVLALDINNSRLAELHVGEDSDGGSDDGYFFEEINSTTTGNNDIDEMRIDENFIEEDLQGTRQSLNFIVQGTPTAGSLEINDLVANGVEEMSIEANARVYIAEDRFGALNENNDGISTRDLELLTITGAADVLIDGLGTAKQSSGVTLTVDAGEMTGDLRLGIQTASDGFDSSDTAGARTDKDLSVVSGSGDDQIVTYEELAGDISTGDGNDVVAITGGYGSASVEGVSTIDTGDGDDIVSALDLEATKDDDDEVANDGFDDITAAAITTGAGEDRVTVQDLLSSDDWDNLGLEDNEDTDRYVVVGASVDTGDDNDVITARRLDEGASINAGAGDDELNVSINPINSHPSSHTVLGGDTDADILALGADKDETREVQTSGAVDRLGAIVDMAGGDDVANFIESDSRYNRNEVTIVGRDAELRGAETVNVVALDDVFVNTTTSNSDQDGITAGVQNDVNANIFGTQTLNLTIANQIDSQTAADTGKTQNDSREEGADIDVDVLRFDDALADINLVSQEQVLLQDPATETFEEGTETEFTINNMREDIALTLSANEATGVDGGELVDDSLLEIDSVTGIVTRNSDASDVELNIDYDGARGTDNSAELLVLEGNGEHDSYAFDLDLDINATTTDLAATNAAGDNGNAASASDDDTMLIENFAVKFADDESHSIDANGFGDVDFRGTRAPAVAGDVSSTASTSFTVWSGAGAGKTIAIADVNADTIAVMNEDGTAVTAANVVLLVDDENNYNITTGSGTDVLDMRADDVRSDDIATALNRADNINAGTGRDTMIVNGSDNLGNNNNLDNLVPTISTIIDDDVFATVRGVEKILVDADYNGGSEAMDITLDEEARTTGVDEIAIVGEDDQLLNLVLGNNFVVATGADHDNGQLTTADSAMVIDASQHVGTTTLNIESKDDDSDVQRINLDIRVSAEEGAEIDLVNTGDEEAQVDIRVYTSHEATAHDISDFPNLGDTDGDVNIDVFDGSIDRLIVLEGANADDGGAEGDMDIEISDDWTGDELEVDASAVLDTDADSTTGGATITAADGDDADLTIGGTQNDDDIIGGRGLDLINGNDGDDDIVGDEVNDQNELEVITFAASYDAGDVISVTHNGETLTATITADGVTGDAVANAFRSRDNFGGDFIVDNITWTGSGFNSATSTNSGLQLRLTGATAGVDYEVSAVTNNDDDNVQQVQTLTGADLADGALEVVFGGTTYVIGDGNVAANYNTLAAAVVALGGTFAVGAGVGNGSTTDDGFTITGPASGAAFPLVTATTSGLLAVTSGDLGTDQDDPQIVTETLARSVLGGADVINGGNGDDVIAGLVGGDTLDGGDGVDTLDYTLSLAGVSVNLAANSASGGDAAGDTISNFENVLGSAYADVLTGNDEANELTGGRGNDTLSGGEGGDTLDAGAGADTVIGGLGDDNIDLGDSDLAEDTVVFASGDGLDAVAFFEAGIDVVQFSDFVDRDLDAGTILFQEYDGVGSDTISGANTELLILEDLSIDDSSILTLQTTIADALDDAFNLAPLSDGRIMFAVNDGTDSWVGYYTDNGADDGFGDTVQASDIEVVAHFDNAIISSADFWLPTV